MKKIRWRFLIAGFAALALAQGSLAAAKPAAKPAKPAAAQSTPGQGPQVSETKEFGDWTVRCFAVSSPSPCEMVEIRVVKKTGQRVLAVLLAYVPSRDANVMQLAVPLGVALQNGIVLAADTFTSPVMHYTRCDIQGCYVQTMIDSETLSALGRATKAQLQIVFVDGRKIALPFSLDGFTAAHSALVDMARDKASKPAAAPATDQQTPDQQTQDQSQQQ